MEISRPWGDPARGSVAVSSRAPSGNDETSAGVDAPRRGRGAGGLSRLVHHFEAYKWSLTVYAATRAVLIVLAVACASIFSGKTVATGPMHVGHPLLVPESLSQELANWDGWWFVHIATVGYPTHVSHLQTTLGFFPLYPMALWLLAHILFCSYVIAGMIISTIGGLVATVQVQRLATRWWGPETGRRAVVIFCLFPGSIVFSMVYPESLLIPLALGCMLALGNKRWALAGLLAGIATATGPDALPLIPMCLIASLRELHAQGWRGRSGLRSLAAPVLSPLGLVGFGAFLWAWTGSPFANLTAQRYGWHERATPFAIPDQLLALLHELGLSINWWRLRTGTGHPAIDLNRIVVIVGTVLLIFGLVWLWRNRTTVPVEVLTYTGFAALLMLTSAHVPPNPRLLLVDVPVVIVLARRFRGRAWHLAAGLSATALVVLSGLTYVGTNLRP